MLGVLFRASQKINGVMNRTAQGSSFTSLLCELILIGTNIYEEFCISRLVYVNCIGKEFYDCSEQLLMLINLTSASIYSVNIKVW